MNENLNKEFEVIVKPLIKFINDNFHPHILIVVDSTSAQLLEGNLSFYTQEFLKDKSVG